MPGTKRPGDRPRGSAEAPVLPRSLFFRARTQAEHPLPATRYTRAELARRLRSFELFSALPLAAIKEVADRVTVRNCHRGDFLWQRGDVARNVVLIDSGFVKAARRDRAGTSKTFALFGPGDSLGLFAFYADMRYPTDAVALNEGLRLLVIAAAELVAFAQRYPPLAAKLQGEVTRFTEAFIDKIEVISAGTIPERLAVLMLQLIGRFGVVHGRDEASLPMFLPQELIGEIIDARIETVARVLARWKRDGWISIDAQGCHLHGLERLRALLPG